MATATTAWCVKNLSYYPQHVTPVGISTIYLAFYTTAPTIAGGGTEVTTGQVANYARIPLTLADWAPDSTGAAEQTHNANPITIPASTGGTGASIVAFGLLDAATGGNLLFFGGFSFTQTTGVGLTLPVNSLQVSLGKLPVQGDVQRTWCASQLLTWPGCGSVPPTIGATLYIGWFSTAPGPVSTGVEVTTTQVTNYARTPIASSVWTLSGQVLRNNTALTTVVSSGGTGVVVNGIAIMTAATGGDLLWVSGINPWSWAVGRSSTYPINALSILLQ